MKRIVSTISLAVAVMLPAQAAARAQERVGTICSDCPNYSYAFSIENNTGAPVYGRICWRNQKKWTSYTGAGDAVRSGGLRWL